MSAFLRALSTNKTNEDELGGQMSFLEHLDELRKRLIRSFIFVFLAASISWFFADRIYNFLAVPVERALADAQRRQVPIARRNGKRHHRRSRQPERKRHGSLCLLSGN